MDSKLLLQKTTCSLTCFRALSNVLSQVLCAPSSICRGGSMKIPNDMNYLVLINRSGKQAFRESELAEKKKTTPI